MSLVALINLINNLLDVKGNKTLSPMEQAFAKAVNR